MSPEITSALINYLHYLVTALLAVAVVFFLLQFLIPGRRAKRHIARASAALTSLRAKGAVLDLDQVRSEAMVSDALRHCWDEYRDTLHGQKQANATGGLEVARWRATATANSFFTDQSLVDTPLRTEFYKHLPGILTGIGIIGTFSGLILGLQAFGQVDLGDAEKARLGLRALLATVGGAFVVSGAAIALAMSLTTVEKIIVNGLYTRVESLCGIVDSLFDAGAGEEYLQRLVEAAETSATQAMQMKESLVTDLKQVLTELTSQQIATMTATSTQLGQTITTSLSDGLKEPLERISNAVQSVSGSQGDAVNKLLTDVLSSFTAQMENMFGGQMRGMGEMLTQTAGTIQQASQRFEQLIGQIDQASAGASQAMAQRMDEALTKMQARQSEANEQMCSFIEQMKKSVAAGQSDAAELTLSMMKELSESTSALVKGLQEQSRNAQQDQSTSQREAAEQMHIFIEQMKRSATQGQSESAELTLSMMKELSDSTSALVKGLQEQSRNAQLDQSTSQRAAAEQIRAVVEQLQDSTSKGQSDFADATSQLLNRLGAATEAGVRSLQEQAAAAQQDQSSSRREAAEQIRAVVQQLQNSTAKAQVDKADATSQLLDRLAASTEAAVRSLRDQAAAAQQDYNARHAAAVADTALMLKSQSEQISRLSDAVQRAESAMRDTVERIKASTDSHLDRMSTGAERLLTASDRLSDNLTLMKSSSDGLTTSADRLNTASGAMASALAATQQTLGDQKAVRDALAGMVTDLRATVETAKREAVLTSALVTGMQQASQRLTEAQSVSVASLEDATLAIGEAHGAFAKQVEVTLRDGNRVFHEELAQAVGLLKGAIQDLGDVLDNLPTPA